MTALPDLPPTTTLGRYRLQQAVGAGGMGVVYRAWDPQLARAIAIKVVKPVGADEGTRLRLVREAQSLARLSHPHVCQVYDVGTEGDEVWVAMELIDGSSLRAWAEGKSPTQLLGPLLDAAEGIHAAHEAGMIHRDVKPENVLVRTTGRAVVTDFGLARADDVVDVQASTAVSEDPRATQATQMTASGFVAGTPAYLAPEQLTGAALDARVDQFAWAVMAWELLTGMRPFPIVHGARLDAIRAGITPPPTMSPALASALTRALALAPRDRYPSMRELIDAVPRALTRPSRRLPILLAAGAVLAVGGGLVAWQLASGDPPREAPAPPALEPPIAITLDAAAVAPDGPPLDAEDPAYAARRAQLAFKPVIAEQLIDAYCTLQADPASDDPELVVDWGPVTRAEVVEGTYGDLTRTMAMYEVKGTRATYRFDGHANDLGVMDVPVGQLVAVCPERGGMPYKLPAAWSGATAMRAFLPIARPPALTAHAALAPIHLTRGGAFSKDATFGTITVEPGKTYLIRARPEAQHGARWHFHDWWLEVPPGTPGADALAVGKTVWIVVDHEEFAEFPDLDKPGVMVKLPLVRAHAVIATMFPPPAP